MSNLSLHNMRSDSTFWYKWTLKVGPLFKYPPLSHLHSFFSLLEVIYRYFQNDRRRDSYKADMNN